MLHKKYQKKTVIIKINFVKTEDIFNLEEKNLIYF